MYIRDKYIYICDKYILKCICFKYIFFLLIHLLSDLHYNFTCLTMKN